MERLVIDASVALKWYLADEDLQEEAVGILNSYGQGLIELVAPNILPYEIFNALRMAERLARIEPEITENSFQTFLDLGIELVDPFSDYPEVLALARAHTSSIYDAAYLCVAETMGLYLVTADKRLFNSTKSLGSVKWLGAYLE